MRPKPKRKVALTHADILIEIVGWLTFFCLWSFTIYSYQNLEGSIPIHFNFSGEPDRFGKKETLFWLPAIGTIIFIAMGILIKYPHVYNYPVPITEENAEKHYTTATSMLRVFKFIVVLIFFLLVFLTYRTATGKISGLGKWFLPLIITIVLLPTIYFFSKYFKRFDSDKK